MRNILFIAHGNNDLDHYMPLIYAIKKYKLNLIYIPDNNSSEISRMHSLLLSDKNIKVFKLQNFVDSKILFLFLNIYSFLKNLNISSVQNKFFFSITGRFCLALNKILNILVFSKTLNNNFKNFLLMNSIDLLIIDLINQKKNENNNIFKKSLNSILGTAKNLNIPLFMISHGANILFDKGIKKIKKNQNQYFADEIALCNKHEIILYKHLVKNLKKIKILGDIRYDYFWINYLKKINRSKIKKLKRNKKIKILYVMGNLTFLKDDKIEKEINSQIIKLTKSPNIELWVKIHPKANTRFDSVNNSNIKIFNREVDISVLTQSADIVLTTHSGVLTEPIIFNKINILFDSWKKKLVKPWTIFDKTQCVIKVKDFANLEKNIINYKKIKRSKKKDIEKFYKKYISGNKNLKEGIIKSYLTEIDNLILNKKNVYN